MKEYLLWATGGTRGVACLPREAALKVDARMVDYVEVVDVEQVRHDERKVDRADENKRVDTTLQRSHTAQWYHPAGVPTRTLRRKMNGVGMAMRGYRVLHAARMAPTVHPPPCTHSISQPQAPWYPRDCTMQRAVIHQAYLERDHINGVEPERRERRRRLVGVEFERRPTTAKALRSNRVQ